MPPPPVASRLLVLLCADMEGLGADHLEPWRGTDERARRLKSIGDELFARGEWTRGADCYTTALHECEHPGGAAPLASHSFRSFACAEGGASRPKDEGDAAQAAEAEGAEVEAAEAPEPAAGKLIEVYWDGDDKWYEAEVLAFDADKARHHVRYTADGLVQHEHLSGEEEGKQVWRPVNREGVPTSFAALAPADRAKLLYALAELWCTVCLAASCTRNSKASSALRASRSQ